MMGSLFFISLQKIKYMKKILLMMMVIVGIAGGCKKEDKTDSMLNKIYGYRTLKTYTVNGLDSLSTFKDSLGLQFIFSYDEVDYRNVLRIDDPTSTEIKFLKKQNQFMENSVRIIVIVN